MDSTYWPPPPPLGSFDWHRRFAVHWPSWHEGHFQSEPKVYTVLDAQSPSADKTTVYHMYHFIVDAEICHVYRFNYNHNEMHCSFYVLHLELTLPALFAMACPWCSGQSAWGIHWDRCDFLPGKFRSGRPQTPPSFSFSRSYLWPAAATSSCDTPAKPFFLPNNTKSQH